MAGVLKAGKLLRVILNERKNDVAERGDGFVPVIGAKTLCVTLFKQ